MAVKSNCEINGKKYFRITCSIGKDENGKYIRKTFYGRSEKEAKQKRDEYLNNLSNGMCNDYKNAFLGSYMKIWLYEVIKVSNIKATSFERYEGIYRNYIKNSPISSLQICSIKSIDIQRYYNSLCDKGKSYSTIKNLNKLLKKFFKYAYNEGYVLKNPCDCLVIPGKENNEEYEVEVFSSEDLYKIINNSENSVIKDMAIISLATGMRRGEVLGLKDSDFNIDNKTIEINRSVKTVIFINENEERNMQTVIQTLKTKSSKRIIPYPTSLIPIIKRIKSRNAANKLKAGASWNNEYEDFLFLTSTGNLIDTSNISRSWKRFLKRLNIEYIKFHALRHTYATKQFEANIPLLTISKLLGHSSIEITANIYTHVRNEAKQKSIDIIDVINM